MASDDLRHTAFHEAGHAVADHRLGLESGGCSIVARDNFAGSASSVRGRSYTQEDRRFALSLFAGYLAATSAGQGDDLARHGARDDFERAAEIIEELGLDRDVVFAEARTLVENNASAISLVAAELLERQHVDGDEVAILVEIADGECTHEDLAQFRVNRSAALGGRS